MLKVPPMQSKSSCEDISADFLLLDACGSFWVKEIPFKLSLVIDELPALNPSKSNAAEDCAAAFGNWSFTKELTVAEALSFALQLEYTV